MYDLGYNGVSKRESFTHKDQVAFSIFFHFALVGILVSTDSAIPIIF